MLQVAQSQSRVAAQLIVGSVSMGPCWRRRGIPESEAFEPVLEAQVTLTGGRDWPGPVVVSLNVTRLDVGICTTCGLGVEEPARDAMRRFLFGSEGVELARLKALRRAPPRGGDVEALPFFGDAGDSSPLFGLPPAEYYSERNPYLPREGLGRLLKGQEVKYIGEERTPRVDPFHSAVEIWVESEESQVHDDVYLFSCRMADGRWEMGQAGYGRHFKAITN